jgi:hypothetical protein
MKILSVATILSMTLLTSPAMAGLFSKKVPEDTSAASLTFINAKESSEQEALKVKALSELQEEISQKFKNIETELASDNSGKALLMAKEVLDTVRVKTGIDPKNRIQESFLVSTKFPKGISSIEELSEAQKNLVIETISNFRAGLYLDIMNLSKRTTLLYIKAFQAQLEKSGGLTQEDKSKIIKDLVKASLVPMPIVDKAGTKTFVFDEDVANEDHTYLFNRELKMYLLENKQIAVNEAFFNSSRAKLKEEIIGKKLTPSSQVSEATTCMINSNSILDYSDKNTEKVQCFNRYYKATPNMAKCSELANYIPDYSNRNTALVICTRKFNN